MQLLIFALHCRHALKSLFKWKVVPSEKCLSTSNFSEWSAIHTCRVNLTLQVPHELRSDLHFTKTKAIEIFLIDFIGADGTHRRVIRWMLNYQRSAVLYPLGTLLRTSSVPWKISWRALYIVTDLSSVSQGMPEEVNDFWDNETESPFNVYQPQQTQIFLSAPVFAINILKLWFILCTGCNS
jgi:hypothetical protein